MLQGPPSCPASPGRRGSQVLGEALAGLDARRAARVEHLRPGGEGGRGRARLQGRRLLVDWWVRLLGYLWA